MHKHKGLHITLDKFSKWLSTLDPNARMVDSFRRCKTCPIARYLKSLDLGYSFISVGPYDCALGNELFGTNIVILPQWAIRFIELYDDGTEDTVGKAVRIARQVSNAS